MVALAASSSAMCPASSCPAQCTQVLPQLRLVARADQHAGHAGPLQQPVDRDLRQRAAGVGGHLVHCVDHAVQPLVVHRRGEGGRLVQPAAGRPGLAAAQPAGEAAPAQRAPHDGAHALVQRQRHQLMLVVPADQGVIGLVGHVALQPQAVCRGQRLHQLPGREVGGADVAHLAGAHQVVQRAQHLFHRRHRVHRMQLQQVDVVGAQAGQRRMHAFDQVVARAAHVVGPRPAAQRQLGGDDGLVPPALERLAQDGFGGAIGVHIGGVEQVDAGLQADVDDAARGRCVGAAPGAEQRALATEGAGAKAQGRHVKAGAAERAVFHAMPLRWMRCSHCAGDGYR